MEQDIFNKVMDALDVAYDYRFSSSAPIHTKLSKNRIKKNAYALRKLVESDSAAYDIVKKMQDRGLIDFKELGIQEEVSID
jgi:hypothetical protein